MIGCVIRHVLAGHPVTPRPFHLPPVIHGDPKDDYGQMVKGLKARMMTMIGFMQLTHGWRVAMLLGLDNPFVCISLVAGWKLGTPTITTSSGTKPGTGSDFQIEDDMGAEGAMMQVPWRSRGAFMPSFRK